MASAIVRGLLENQHYLPEQIACTCGNDPTGPELAKDTGIQYFSEITEVVKETEIIVLACKPQQFDAIDPSIATSASGKLILSILAGTPLARLSAKFSDARNIVRTMPNTPGQIGAGVTAFTPLLPLNVADANTVANTLSSLGNFHQVEEADLDAVTALSGSGPAYVFEFAAALHEAGKNCGLDAELAKELAIDTLLGAAMLLAQSESSAEELRNAVTSPGGTTAAALKSLEDQSFRAIINQALAAAKARSIELASI